MERPLRIVHFLNQFFAGVGGEEEAELEPQWFEGARGPGKILAAMGQDVEVIGTLAAGDNHMAENLEQAVPAAIRLLVERLAGRDFDLLLAGPAFNAGRYGLACCAICKSVQEELRVAAITGLYPESPAVESYRRTVTIVRCGSDVMDMQGAVRRMLSAGRKRVRGESLTSADDSVIPNGVRRNYFARKTGAERAVAMLMAKLGGTPFVTEYPMPSFDRVSPAAGVVDARTATVALVTTGGIVPRGNPDRIEAANASRYGEYSLHGLERLTSETHQSVHGGYDPTYANADPNRVLPVDVMRSLERKGRIGRLHGTYFATVGNATSVERAKRYGAQIAAKLVNEGVQAVVFTST